MIDKDKIAIIGIGCRFPGGIKGPESFWNLLVNGIDAITEVPADRFDINAYYDPKPQTPGKIVTRYGGFIDRVDKFDADFFGISPREAHQMDPQQRLLAEVGWEAFEDAGFTQSMLSKTKAAVYVGIYSNDYENRMFQNLSSIDLYAATGGAHYSAAGRLSYLFDLKGPSVTVETACSSSLVAIHLACKSLWSGESQLAIAGGVNLIINPHHSIAYSNGGMLSPEGRCKFGDAEANGFARAEGCGLVILKPLLKALECNDRIYATILGSAINNDGRNGSIVAPSHEGQVAVQEEAYLDAGVPPGSSVYVEAHGTGTIVGDPVEMRSLGQVIGRQRPSGKPCLVGSVKSNFGHAETASGIAGLIKTALCLHHRKIPPSLHFKTPNREIQWNDLNLEIPVNLRDLPEEGSPAIAGINSFGLTGMNAHIVMQELPTPTKAATPKALMAPDSNRTYLLPLSAKSPESLSEMLDRWQEYLTEEGTKSAVSIHDICYSASLRRTHHEYRLAVIGQSRAEFCKKLSDLQSSAQSSVIERIGSYSSDSGGLVFVFSGQGPQWFGMGQELLEQEPVFLRTIERISRLLKAHACWSLIDEMQADETSSRMDQTEVAQPAIFALQIALAALWESWGVRPDAVVGHSIGEVAAACYSGVLSLEDAVRVVYHRGRLLQRAHGKGRMAAVGLPPEEAEAVIAEYASRLSIAAVNSPTSITISGDPEALGDLLESLKGRSLFCRMLAVNYAFHSHHVEPYRLEMTRSVEGIEIQQAAIPIWSTVTGKAATTEDFGAEYWAENIRRPVQFAAAVDDLIQKGHRTFIELSPHPVLGSAISQCLANRGISRRPLCSLRRNCDEIETLLAALCALYVQGQSIDWKGLFPDKGHFITLPTYCWKKKRFWIQHEDDQTAPAGPISWEKNSIPDLGATTVPSSCEDSPGDLLMHVEWHPKRHLNSRLSRKSSDHLPTPKQIVERLRQELPVECSPEAGALAEGALVCFDHLSVGYIINSVRELGWSMTLGDSATTKELCKHFGIEARHGRLFARMLEILEQDGLLRRVEAAWEVAQRPKELNLQQLWASALSAYPELESELTLLRRCGSALASVLRGQRDPLELLFPAEALGSAENLYEGSQISRVPNHLICRIGAHLTEELPRGRVLRVLEIGAGTGGTTSHLLSELPTHGIEYVFSDVSSLFLEKGRSKFSGYPFMRYQLLDIEKDPESQGFAPHQFDVVLAANVVHATAELRKSLDHISRLLTNSGLMLLVEGVRPTRWIDLIFGQLEGWWKFSDTDLRPDYPLMSADAWKRLLGDLPFVEADTISAVNGPDGRLFEQAVVVAKALPGVSCSAAIADIDSAGGTWLIFADQAGIGRCLAERIRSRGEACLLVYPGDAFGQRDGDEVRINPSRPEDYRRIVEDIAGGDRLQLHTVVHLWSLELETWGWMDSAECIEKSIEWGCSSALYTLQALAASGTGDTRLWLVTRGAQSVGDEDPLRHPNQAPIWGIGRTAANEHPDLWGGLVDLDPIGESAEMAANLMDAILNPETEDQFAVRGGERLVPRLLPLPECGAPTLTIRSQGSYLITGGLGDLGLETARWLANQGARRLILMSRTPLPHRSDWDRVPSHTREFSQIAALRALEVAGAETKIASVDVSDEAQLRAFLDGLQGGSWQPVRGVIHAAAQFERRLIQHQDAESFRLGMRTKLVGAWLLHRLLEEESLDFFIGYSSFASLFGLIGLSSYAAANIFVDAMAHYRRGLCLPALSVNWGLWSGYGFVSKLVKQRAEEDLVERGVETLTPLSAFPAFGDLANSGVSQGGIAKINWPKFRQAYGSGKFAGLFSHMLALRGNGEELPRSNRDAPDDNRLHSRLLASKLGEPRRKLMESLVADILGQVLRMKETKVRRDKPFGDYGLDSLMAVELKNRCESALGISLPATLAWNYPTIAALSEHLAGQLGLPLDEGSGSPISRVPAVVDLPESESVLAGKTNQMMESIGQLSEMEVLARLLQKPKGPKNES